MIIPALYARQRERGGYLSIADLNAVAEELAVPLHRIESLVSFFPHFRTEPPKKVEVHVCRDMACHLRGSLPLTDRLQTWANDKYGSEVEVCGVSCLGRCDRPAATLINDQLYVARDCDELKEIIDAYWQGQPPAADSDRAYAATKAYQWEMDVYQGTPQYTALQNYLKRPQPQEVLQALETAGLLGMGGAGGRAYLKWTDVSRAKGKQKFVVCNADESEPGTFKDREILLTAPHLIIEGIILGGLVVGATRGWLYIRHEYQEQIASLRGELERIRELGLLGNNLLGSEKDFELDIFVSPGGYICGEQTALIEAMENKRAEPRNRPPELMTNGYQDQPTLLNNVETFAWVPAILLRSAGQWYAEQGRRSAPWPGDAPNLSNGKRLFSVSGDVAVPGVVEVPTGIPLGELIDEYCGGMAQGKELVAVALSGPSGGLLPPKIPVQLLSPRFVQAYLPAGMTEFDIRQLPLDISVSREIGLMIGAGLVIYGSGADVLAEAMACSRFFRNESCGKCVPCRLGSQKITQMGEDLLGGKLPVSQLPILSETALELAQVMTATSICGLGQVASNPVRSILTYFPDLAQRACGAVRPTPAGPDLTPAADCEQPHG